jgi:DNA-binding protein
MSEEAIIFIGSKPPMRYVTAMITSYNQQGVDSITLKARGRAISRAVDVAEITRNRFLTDLESPSITIDTEQLPAMDGGTRGVSTIAISFQLLADREVHEREAFKPREEAPEAEPEEPEADEPEADEPEADEPEADEPEADEPEADEPEAVEPAQRTISDVKGIGKATNEKLEKAGVDSVVALASYDPDELSEKTGISAKTCAKLVAAAKDLV